MDRPDPKRGRIGANRPGGLQSPLWAVRCALTQVLDVAAPAATTTRIEGLVAGTWYFTVASYTNTGVESVQAGPVSKAVQ